ncbi:putative glycosyl transferase [Paratrimastix pyriformis]|uniref:Glycosyl transferase n=1 Tax=Paratrimastix pyriformis TaxID=342808 RepID=A0ABQ8UEA2_9EUKA|nr:putative glycosyl transferase [Paratrimastix pyriformis]|eukprot:GAFH01001541.1.p1 GENE.GAFH01001541.1~~GAFH01001541.1.p1  ORF type:complete len:329 (-),score=5.24 GAFH01001541.1:534-1520(-)
MRTAVISLFIALAALETLVGSFLFLYDGTPFPSLIRRPLSPGCGETPLQGLVANIYPQPNESYPLAKDQAFVTICSSDDYCRGALALMLSLRQTGTTRHLVVMYSPKEISPSTLTILQQFHPSLHLVPFDPSAYRPSQRTIDELERIHKPHWKNSFTKLAAFSLTNFTKVIYIDSDSLVVQNIDELFLLPHFSCTYQSNHEPCSPRTVDEEDDTFQHINSGLFVTRPSQRLFQELMGHLADPSAVWWNGDQQILLHHFGPQWNRLPQVYSVGIDACACGPDVYRPSSIKVVHFYKGKPWSPPSSDRHPCTRSFYRLWQQYTRNITTTP